MKQYEVMYIINASVEEEKRAGVIADLGKIVTDHGGRILKTDEWGMRSFAYRIDDMTKGYYVVVTFEADNDTVKEFGRLLRINPSVVRYMIVNKTDELAKAAKAAKGSTK